MQKATVKINAAKIAGMADAGMTTAQIVQLTGFQKNTVLTWKRRYQESGNAGLEDRRINNSSYRVTTPAEDLMLVEEVAENPFVPPKTLALNVNIGDVSSSTIRRRLRKHGLHCHKAAKKTALQQFNKDVRLDFANRYQNLDIHE